MFLAKLVNVAEAVVEEEEVAMVGETEEGITMGQDQTETTMGETGLVHIERKRRINEADVICSKSCVFYELSIYWRYQTKM